MVRRLTFGFAILFTVVVVIGYVPQFSAVDGDERLLFGLFELSILDDIVHGVTALAAIAATATSRKACLLFLTAFGFYYALDAIFFLTYGMFNDLGFMADILLNLPHVVIATVMLWTVYAWAPKHPGTSPM